LNCCSFLQFDGKKMSDSVAETTKEIAEGPEALAAAVGIPNGNVNDEDNDDNINDNDDNESTAGSTGTVDLRKMIHAEVSPPKSLVVIWLLMAVELGFDLITTAIAFVSTLGKQDCCGHTVYLGPLPVTTSVPFFFLILTEITFLGRAILLTLWPSIFEARRVALHEENDDDSASDDEKRVGFEVTPAVSSGTKDEDDDDHEDDHDDDYDDKKSRSRSDADSEKGKDDNDSSSNNTDNNVGDADAAGDAARDIEQVVHGETKEKTAETDDQEDDEDDASDANKDEKEETITAETKKLESPAADPGADETQDTEQEQPRHKDNDNDSDDHKDRPPEFIVDSNAKQQRQPRKPIKTKQKPSRWKRACCCLMRWNARMVLWVLNMLTLLNPFFGCLIAYILLYQSDKTECFVVLTIESLSIVLHFVSVRLEGGLRTWYSKAFHSIALIPFLVTVVMVLVFLREGGMCYSVETELFLFSGCEVCPDTLVPPVDGMCGNFTLKGSGGFREEFQDLGDSFGSFGDLKNIVNIAKRGAEQANYCSNETNFCFFEF